jgi:hypothetical protein
VPLDVVEGDRNSHCDRRAGLLADDDGPRARSLGFGSRARFWAFSEAGTVRNTYSPERLADGLADRHALGVLGVHKDG